MPINIPSADWTIRQIEQQRSLFWQQPILLLRSWCSTSNERKLMSRNFYEMSNQNSWLLPHHLAKKYFIWCWARVGWLFTNGGVILLSTLVASLWMFTFSKYQCGACLRTWFRLSTQPTLAIFRSHFQRSLMASTLISWYLIMESEVHLKFFCY